MKLIESLSFSSALLSPNKIYRLSLTDKTILFYTHILQKQNITANGRNIQSYFNLGDYKDGDVAGRYKALTKLGYVENCTKFKQGYKLTRKGTDFINFLIDTYHMELKRFKLIGSMLRLSDIDNLRPL